MKLFLCSLLTVVLHCVGSSEIDSEKTAAAVVKAVVSAESNSAAAEEKEAAAVADATVEVVKSESPGADKLPEEVMAHARVEAQKTFTELKDAKVGTEASADAAAKVVVAEVDGASGLDMSSDVQKNAEKAAVAAGTGLADHPDDEVAALGDAILTVKKSEWSQNAMDEAKSNAEDPVDILSRAKGVTLGAVAGTYDHTELFVGLCLLALLAILSVGYRNYRERTKVTPYMMKLRAIRQEEELGESGCPTNVEAAEYTEMI
jgi:hypothetical protein